MGTDVQGNTKFDKLPFAVQLLAGIGGLAVIAIVGFLFLFAVDIVLLDVDPIGSLFRAIF